MPSAQGFTVSLVTADGQEFAEYGNQKLPGSASKSSTVSTKVRAKDGEKFKVKIKVEQPFPYPEKKANNTNAFKPLASSISRYNLRSSGKALGGNGNGNGNGSASDNWTNNNRSNTLPPKPNFEKPPYRFVVWVYIDGHEMAECCEFVATEPNSPQVLNGRYTTVNWRRRNGNLKHEVIIQEWMFTPVGIEVLLSKMDIGAADPATRPSDAMDQELDDVIQSLEDVNKPEVKKNKPGQIEVRITRIVDLGSGKKGGDWRRDGERNSAAKDVDDNNTHTVGVGEKPRDKLSFTPHAWRPYDDTEEYYARFVFQYMGIEKLVNLGLCTPDGQVVTTTTTEQKPQGQNAAGSGSSPLASNTGTDSTGSHLTPLKRPIDSDLFKKDGNKVKVTSEEHMCLSDEDQSAGEESSSSDESDRPRKRHESIADTEKSKPWDFTRKRKPLVSSRSYNKKSSVVKGPRSSSNRSSTSPGSDGSNTRSITSLPQDVVVKLESPSQMDPNLKATDAAAAAAVTVGGQIGQIGRVEPDGTSEADHAQTMNQEAEASLTSAEPNLKVELEDETGGDIE
ncbi:hypothetical protein HRR83_000247 [Exophiala dermatitidis]|uniref:Uncharacterized protein n=2 Tax=Exophiala dermatitidis TaxID=5970 RepID=H6C8R3_EXODN|nr:uncharacterized protein HMPREF1120_08448 [Exophiala dermatitidis NIH/UT8656]KAJ4523600.1 hypothetical protein HRR73_002783 [Exophiala dermatitidis]EHY60490.1 hypothetical protein HMPREF1120_08448 [Exophiala dermatitidis NIH/UT8656]KAJ4524631.1 hypothetical protein HRR75_000221 [Exophiala dermatitidis]KAJ4527494.1 hypothetical protein HRR74_000248 [Exophiala dermatitidis]KAJ4531065.1 hypothetical protein HRR76_008745 [Exophiala dermatitidis]